MRNSWWAKREITILKSELIYKENLGYMKIIDKELIIRFLTFSLIIIELPRKFIITLKNSVYNF